MRVHSIIPQQQLSDLIAMQRSVVSGAADCRGSPRFWECISGVVFPVILCPCWSCNLFFRWSGSGRAPVFSRAPAGHIPGLAGACGRTRPASSLSSVSGAVRRTWGSEGLAERFCSSSIFVRSPSLPPVFPTGPPRWPAGSSPPPGPSFGPVSAPAPPGGWRRL